jgi:WD40 repeat protein
MQRFLQKMFDSAEGFTKRRIPLARDRRVRLSVEAIEDRLVLSTTALPLHVPTLTPAKIIATVHTAILWDVANKKERARFEGHKGGVMPEFCLDAKIVVTWASGDETVRLWDVATGKEQGRVREKAGVKFAVVSPDGQTLATTGEDGSVRLHSLDASTYAAK